MTNELSKIDAVKELRRLTNLGIKECKDALEDSDGDLDTALAVLKTRGVNVAMNKIAKDRPMTEGVIEVYQHFTKQIAVMVEVNCQTDFVAGTERFRKFAHNVARWIIATGASTVEELLYATIDESALEGGNEVYWKATVNDRLLELVAEVGESIQIRRFHVFNVGEDLA